MRRMIATAVLSATLFWACAAGLGTTVPPAPTYSLASPSATRSESPPPATVEPTPTVPSPAVAATPIRSSPVPVTRVEGSARRGVKDYLSTLYPAACLNEVFIDHDPTYMQKTIREAALTAPTGGPIIGGRAFLGDLADSARSFAAAVLIVGSDATWMVTQRGDAQIHVQPPPGIPTPAPDAAIGLSLDSVALSDGRQAWYEVGDYVATVACVSPGPGVP